MPMKNRLLKGSIIASISILAFLAVRQTVHACASSGLEEDSDYYSLYSSELMGSTHLFPFFYTISSAYYESKLARLADQDTTDDYLSNTAEWNTYMKGVPSENDVDAFIYKSKIADLEQLRNSIQHKAFVLRDSFKQNTAYLYLQKRGDVDAVNYLLFAKRCEPQANVSYGGGWDALPQRDTVLMKNLIAEGLKTAEHLKSPFLKFRYGFQLVRMAHYSGQYEQCLTLYDALMKGKNETSIVSLWGIALQGGALTRLKRGDEAAYIFSKLFDKHFSFNYDLYRQNFEWARGDALPLCQTDHERVVVYALQGFAERENLPMMEQIALLEPGSEYLEVLLTRDIKWLENDMLPHKYVYGPFEIAKANLDVATLTATRNFVVNTLHKGGVRKPYLWEYTAGYLSYLLKDVNATSGFFAQARLHAPENELLKAQSAVITVMQKTELATVLDQAFENRLFADIRQLDEGSNQALVPDALHLLYRNLGNRYLEANDTVHYLLYMAYEPTMPDLLMKPGAFDPGTLIRFLNRTDLTPLENMLCINFQTHLSLGALHELKGTVYLQKYRFKEAEAEFEQGGKELTVLPANPFEMHIADCHDCDFKNDTGSYSKLTFVQRMIVLEQQAAHPGRDQANAAFLLGNGYYNMTYFGSSWSALTYYRNVWGNEYQFYDCSTARRYYEMAAKLSNDKEFKAKCTFMASKCELNAYYQQKGYGFEEQFAVDPGAKSFQLNYKLLKDNFADTRYYQEVIKECSYFRAYVRQ